MTSPLPQQASNSLLSGQSAPVDLPNTGDEAINSFFADYYRLVVQRANRNLGEFPQAAYDAEDVAASAFLSLLKRARSGSAHELTDRSELLRLLFAIARKKAATAIRRESTKKRRRSPVSQSELIDPPCPGPQPDQIAILRELFASLLNRLTVELRPVAELKLQGLTNAEIAQTLGVVPRTVDRKLRDIRELCRVVFQ